MFFETEQLTHINRELRVFCSFSNEPLCYLGWVWSDLILITHSTTVDDHHLSSPGNQHFSVETPHILKQLPFSSATPPPFSSMRIVESY